MYWIKAMSVPHWKMKWETFEILICEKSFIDFCFVRFSITMIDTVCYDLIIKGMWEKILSGLWWGFDCFWQYRMMDGEVKMFWEIWIQKDH